MSHTFPSSLRWGLVSFSLLWAGTQPMAAQAGEQPAIACPCGKPDYALALNEDFDKLSLQRNGGPGRWSTTGDGSNAYQLGNRTLPHERELYTDTDVVSALKLPPANQPFHIHDGILSITAAPLPDDARKATNLDYSSGLLVTKRSFLFEYGYVEVRAKVPAGRGLWPAIWLFRPDATYGEIDILELLGQEPGRAYSTIHYQVEDTGGAHHVEQTLVADSSGPSLSEGFHTYAVDWSATDVRFFIDGVEKGRSPTRPALNAPMYLLLNLAVGGAGSWPGPVDGSTVFPASFEIDYARIWTPHGAFVR